MKSTTEPFHPNTTNINSNSKPNLNIWEFPDNGLDSTNHPESILIQKFNDNYKGKPLETKQLLTYCTHPHWLNIDYPRLVKLFDYIDPSLAITDNGPVIYTTENTTYNAYMN